MLGKELATKQIWIQAELLHYRALVACGLLERHVYSQSPVTSLSE